MKATKAFLALVVGVALIGVCAPPADAGGALAFHGHAAPIDSRPERG